MKHVLEHSGSQTAAASENNPSLPVVTGANPLDLPANVFQAGLDRRGENRTVLMAWVRSALIEGVDFGRIPTKRGPSKPSLWKPGAEKICGMLGLTVHFPNLHDYEQAALNGVALQNIIIRCEIVDGSGHVVANGVGARSLKQDYGDINKALKMAEKSAHIDATLRMAGLSEVFTQDLEDMQPVSSDAGNKPATAPSSSPSAQAGANSGCGPEPSGANGTSINSVQLNHLLARINTLQLDPERVRQWVARASKGQIQDFNELTRALYERLLSKLDDWAERMAIQEAE